MSMAVWDKSDSGGIAQHNTRREKAARERGFFLRLHNAILIDAVNPHADQLIDAEVVNSP